MGFMTVDESTYMPINGFTTVDLGCERGNNAYYPVQKTESYENANYFLKLFEQLWNDKKKLQEVTDVVIENKNQLALAYEGDASQMNKKLDTTKSIDEIFRQAQKAFNAWSKLPADERATDELLRTLDFDFFELLDSVTIARSRKHIEKYYNTSDIGKFPERLPPISLRPCLTDLNNAINYNDIYNLLMSLSLTIYTPSNYIMPSKLAK